uniref:Transferrin-like domain-containing protein n=1 Tax=Leptobrachium leishanense TaxID=445787 RepID=A0A8C5MQB6_9ANUR
MSPCLRVAVFFSLLALCLAAPKVRTVRWCAKSEDEYKKCDQLSKNCKVTDITLQCKKKSDTVECFQAIKNGEADAICVDGGDVHRGSMTPYKLKPIVAENYGTAQEVDTCYSAVAVVKKSSTFMFKDLQDKKSCHTGIGKSAGWNVPIGLLLDKELIPWAGPDIESIEKAVARFFRSSCAPGAKESKLCELCIGKGTDKCKRSNNEPYYNYNGASQCLQDGKGDVAFVKDSTFSPAKFDKEYELLCPDDTRKPLRDYKSCFLAKVPAHAVMARDNDQKTEDIIEYLKQAQEKKCQLFSSQYGKDLLFKDSAVNLIPLPPAMDALLYLGINFYDTIQALKHEKPKVKSSTIRFCTQSKSEKEKCDIWSTVSGGAIECTVGTSAENCIHQVLKGEADTVTLDGGYLYTAGQCGLVPVMGEYYDKGSYFAVAVVKKTDKTTKWPNLKGTKSCHTAVQRTAGWNIPVGLLVNITNNCDMSKYFSESCAPGADPASNLCKLCIGDPKKNLENTKCSPSNKESFFGYAGAMRCLAGPGQVAFVKDSTVLDNTDGKNTAEWAKSLKSSDFELLCPDGSRAPVTDAKNCNLAEVPCHALVSRPERRKQVLKVMINQQSLYGKKGAEKDIFQMYGSKAGRDDLFKDSTQCLIEIEAATIKEFLGERYYAAVTSLNQCPTKSGCEGNRSLPPVLALQTPPLCSQPGYWERGPQRLEQFDPLASACWETWAGWQGSVPVLG